MTIDKPYFMENKEWFYFDEVNWMYKITNKATSKARESYKKFCAIIDGD